MGCVQSKSALKQLGGRVQSDDPNLPPYHLTAGNVNSGTNHGVINQNVFFQAYLSDDTASPDPPQEQYLIQKEPSLVAAYCHVPGHISSASTCSQVKGVASEYPSGSTPVSSGMGEGSLAFHLSDDDSCMAVYDLSLHSAGTTSSDLLALDNARKDCPVNSDENVLPFTPPASRPIETLGVYTGSRSNSKASLPSPVYEKQETMEVSGVNVPHPDGKVVQISDGWPGEYDFTRPYRPQADEARLSVSVDFGTTFSGVAYASSRIAGGQVQQIITWPGSLEPYHKIPTRLAYDDMGQVIGWGWEAKDRTRPYERFKLFLGPSALCDECAVGHSLPDIPPGKKPIDLTIDFLTCLWNFAKGQIAREIGSVADLDTADIWLIVPAAWDAKSCEVMREAAVAAGLVASPRAGDTSWRDRLKLITKPEAAAVHCAHSNGLHHLRPQRTFIVCNAGGSTVDLAVYKLIGDMAHLEIADMGAKSGAICGSAFLDSRFRDLVNRLLCDYPVHLDPASMAYFVHDFQAEKLSYAGIEDDDNLSYFTCFNVEDPHDPSVGLFNGQLSIPGILLRLEVFDPVVNQVLQLLEEQITRADQPIDALLLVGGFAGCNYLMQRVTSQFSNRIPFIIRPPDADTAALRGAAHYGLEKETLVSTMICPRSYIMKVKTPAEQEEDWLKRPAYLTSNDTGVLMCDNRIQYVVPKGAFIRKGQRLTKKYSKFSQEPSDSLFVATLFTSDDDKTMRYTDEGELHELCNLTVDLKPLPGFRQNAATASMAGFHTEFELELEFDSPEIRLIRGYLVYDGQELGRVNFDPPLI